MSSPTPSVRRLLIALALLALVAVTGCWNPFQPSVLGRGVSTPPPAPNTPSNTLLLFKWCYENRSQAEYRELFTADYRFAFAALDTNGNAYRDQPWTRDDELESSRKLFEGGEADQPAASLITLVLDRSFRVQNDTRPGKYNPEQRKTITTQVNLTIQTVDGTATNVNGKATFFLVRGDSALIPDDIGLGPDPNRWYIERWEDQTYAPTGAQALMAGGSAGALPASGTAAHAGLRPASVRVTSFSAERGGNAVGPSRPAQPATAAAPHNLFWGALKVWYR
jgi:hypothetical protein